MMSIEYDLSDDEHGASLEEEHQNEFNAMVTKKKKKNTYGKKKHALSWNICICSMKCYPQCMFHFMFHRVVVDITSTAFPNTI